MSVISVGNTLSTNYVQSLRSTGTISDLIDNVSDTSGIEGITNVDSYVSNGLTASNINTTYSSLLQTNPFNVSNMTNALDAISSNDSLDGITDINNYAAEKLEASQLTETTTLDGASDNISNFSSLTDLDSSVYSSIEESQLGLSATNSDFSGITSLTNTLGEAYDVYKSKYGSSDSTSGNTIDTQV